KDELFHFTHPRKLLYALRRHREIAYLGDDDRAQLDRADKLLRKLLERRNQYPIAELLRLAVAEAEYLSVIAANFDGAQKLANVRKLFTLAERFEHAGAHLVRDFVRYVEDFEAIGSREGEGQIDDSANAVRLMTIHQAKGLEFPVVIIPNLHHRTLKPQEHWYALDRHRGLTVKIPDGRGKQVAGCTLERFRARNQLREHFESVRLLYVAATRAQNRLILAGVTESLDKLKNSPDNWLKLIWQKLELQVSRSGVVDLDPTTQLQVTLNSVADSLIDLAPRLSPLAASLDVSSEKETVASLTSAFPLLQPIAPVLEPQFAGQRLSVTQLINYERCPRQYYFDRVLRIPSADELAIWNNAEAPEPPANLNATLKGAVIHRFCETYTPGDDVQKRLAESFSDLIRTRQSQLADRLEDINVSEALKELSPLAENYLASEVFQRAERARRIVGDELTRLPAGEAGLWSELTFRLRRPWGILTGTIDKLLITPSANGAGFEVEIIDFKTNRITAPAPQASGARVQAAAVAPPALLAPMQRGKRIRSSDSGAQFAFEFSSAEPAPQIATDPAVASTMSELVSLAASDYRLQMQAYALAVHELLPALSAATIRVTLHFLHPNVEWMLPAESLTPEACVAAIDGAMKKIICSVSPEDYPVRPARHCGMCAFLRICAAGRE
ncbi:MAG TPA: PD-(D/E)XK nuclease family protein, partial [Pyrinomonadaceae bacterium]|nr:PD-(D/E)XK nuclease family protein [Pyrinomonadaceae bacterium]